MPAREKYGNGNDQIKKTRSNLCPECGARYIEDPGNEELVCPKCGYVPDEKSFNRGYDWRAFDAEQMARRPRAGIPTKYSVHDKNLPTTIDSYQIRGVRQPTQAQKLIVYKLRKWQTRTRIQSAQEKSMSIAFAEMNHMIEPLKLPSWVVEQASIVYRMALKQNIIRGR